jgi:hypothetical protein
MNPQYAVASDSEVNASGINDADLIEKVAAKAEHLESLLASLSISAGSGLETVHLFNALWLAADLAREISTTARLID